MRLRVPRRLYARLTTLLALGSLAASPAAAQRLLVNTNDAGKWVYGGLHYGGDQWQAMTATINGAFSSVTTVATMTNLTQMLEYDALWVDQRWHATASADEIANMMAFAATGRRVVVMGENTTWGGWNNQVLTALGGREGPAGGFPGGAGCMYGRIMGLTGFQLTAGVTGINTACAGYAIGGTQLFAYNVATLWRPEQNVLTVLDGNLFDDLFAAYEAPLFRTRVVSWLSQDLGLGPNAGTSAMARMSAFSFDEGALDEGAGGEQRLGAFVATPEPSTVMLLAAGVAALGAVRRRRRA